MPEPDGDLGARRRPGTGRPGGPGPGGGAGPAIGVDHIRRVLKDLDSAGLDARLTSWFFTRTGTIAGRRVIAVEDETMRGARTGSNPAPHLLAAPGRAAGTALTQRRVADKSNEIPALRDLLAPLDLDGAVAGADATAHPEGHRPVDHLPRRPLPPDGQGHAGRA